jgi:hypothetical protein
VITKDYILELKKRGNGDLGYLLEKQKDNKSIVFILENLGHLPDNFNGEIFKTLLKHDFGKIRLLAAKNIAKLSDTENLDLLYQAFKNETDTTVKREIVSAD